MAQPASRPPRRARRTPAVAAPGRPVSPERYAAFIGQIELAAVWLQAARVVNHRGPEAPAEPEVEVAAEAQLSPLPTGFRCYHTYRVRVLAAADLAAELEATFGVDFRAPAPPSPELFALFQTYNLPVNTWPYLRALLADVLGRMNWLPLTLPALKRGVPSPSGESATPAD